MTCYMRHMDWLFDELAIPSDKKNRGRVDKALRSVFGMREDAHCPEIWAAIKAMSDEGRTELIGQVGDALQAG